MDNLNESLVDKIAQTCFDFYNKLPKTGKPVDKEWTVLSCVVKHSIDKDLEVVSLGTGSKCIGATKMSSKGEILNDSHAEIFARRGFLSYLYNNIEKCIDNEDSIFSYDNGCYILKNNIEFIFYSSQLPCGDASIIPKNEEVELENEEQFGDVLQLSKRKTDDSINDSKRQKISDDIFRTGAKCLPDSDQDPKQPGANYHLVGKVRTKPGRGDRTLSVSCSDKISRWIHLGLQGSLLDMLCEPIYIKHFIFGGGVPYSEDTLKRALLNRNLESSLTPCVIPMFYQTRLKFVHARTDVNPRPAPGSIVWSKSHTVTPEVAIQGRRLGITKKKANNLNASLSISKYNLYKRFINILNKNSKVKQRIVGNENVNNVPYNKMKKKSKRYHENWLNIKNNFFKVWTVKPDMWDFCINISD